MKLLQKDIEKWTKFWNDEGDDTFKTADDLYKMKRYHHALFFCHLGVEKQKSP